MSWFVRRGADVDGPYSQADLVAQLQGGELSHLDLVAPNRHDFHLVHEWQEFHPQGARRAADFPSDGERSAPPLPPAPINSGGTQILGAPADAIDSSTTGNRSLALDATMAMGSRPPTPPAPAHPNERTRSPRAEGKTAVMGTANESEEENASLAAPQWPGAQQQEPHAEPPSPTAPRAPTEEKQTGETEPAASFSPRKPVRSAPPINEEGLYVPNVEPRQESSPPQSPPLGAPKAPAQEGASRGIAYVPTAKLPPVKSSWGAPAILGTIAGVFVLALFVVAIAVRAVNGTADSHLDEYLPAGSAWYVELPSVRRLKREMADLRFMEWSKKSNFGPFEELQKMLEAETKSPSIADVLTSLEAFAACEVDGMPLIAVRHADVEPMEKFLTSRQGRKGTSTKLGFRFTLGDGQLECLWRSVDRVSLCGVEGSLFGAEDVLEGRTAPASKDSNWAEAKRRPWTSYLPFAEFPALYAVNTTLPDKGDPLAEWGFRGTTLSATLTKAGLVEKLDILLEQPESPVLATPGPLTFAQQLPAETLLYLNFRADWPRRKSAYDDLREGTSPAFPGGPAIGELIDRVEEALGTPLDEIGAFLGQEVLLAIIASPEFKNLETQEDFPRHWAFWFSQEVEDRKRVKKVIQHLFEELTEDSPQLRWSSEWAASFQSENDWNGRILIEKETLRIVVGRHQEVAHALANGPRLTADPAHQDAMAVVADDASAIFWLDGGRAWKQGRLPSSHLAREVEKWRKAVITQGDRRITVAMGIRQYEAGPLRVRSLNFPIGMAFLGALSTAKPLFERRSGNPPLLISP